MKNKAIVLYLAVIALLLVAVLAWYAYSYLSQPKPESINFDGPRAYADIQTQFALGSRLSRAAAHARQGFCCQFASSWRNLTNVGDSATERATLIKYGSRA